MDGWSLRWQVYLRGVCVTGVWIRLYHVPFSEGFWVLVSILSTDRQQEAEQQVARSTLIDIADTSFYKNING